MAFSAFTRAATNAAGRSRLVGLLFVPAQECHRFTVEIITQVVIFPLSACSYWDVSSFCDFRPQRLSIASYHVSMMVC